MKSLLAMKGVWFMISGALALNFAANQKVKSVPEKEIGLPIPCEWLNSQIKPDFPVIQWEIQAQEMEQPAKNLSENRKEQKDQNENNGDWIAFSN